MAKTPVHVWFDGSYRAKSDIGVGWAWKEDGKLTGDSRIARNYLTDGDEAHGSHYAELIACFYALKGLPDQSVVIAHTDSEDLIRWMDLGAEVFTQRKTRDRASIGPLKVAFEHALEQKNRMQSVTFEHTRDKNNEGMKLAHTLAQSASTPKDKGTKKPHANQDPQRPASPRRS